MEVAREISASVNSEFAKAILCRAAEILAADQRGPDANTYVALRQAYEEFTAKEPKKQAKHRIYGFGHLLVDLRTFIQQQYPEYSDHWSLINNWSRESDRETVVQKLREAATVISDTVAERTRNAAAVDFMSRKERGEYFVMRKAATFLEEEGLTICLQWERTDTTAPVDYTGAVDGELWAFEITELKKAPPKAQIPRRQIGNPKGRKTHQSQMDDLEQPIPQIPHGPEVLQRTLDKAVKHGLGRVVKLLSSIALWRGSGN